MHYLLTIYYKIYFEQPGEWVTPTTMMAAEHIYAKQYTQVNHPWTYS